MASSNKNRFAEGLLAGLIATPAIVLGLEFATGDAGAGSLSLPGSVTPALKWAASNLGYSTPVFALVFVLFVLSLAKLRRMLDQQQPVAEIAHADYLTDTWVSLFFGVGVIWTAIGMRGALIHALGDPDATMAGGAFAILEKMVDGGILLALSTTIFGGVGGYLLRIVKTVTVGSKLKRCYERASMASARNIEVSLQSIDARLASIVQHEQELPQ